MGSLEVLFDRTLAARTRGVLQSPERKRKAKRRRKRWNC